MNKLLFHLLFLSLSFALCSCGAFVGNNKVLGYVHSKEKIERVHIQAELGNAKGYTKKIAQNIQKQLAQESIESVVSYIDPMDLNSEENLKQKADEFKPVYTLHLKLTDSSVYHMKQGGDITTLSFHISIKNTRNNKRVWDGDVIMSVGVRNKYQTSTATKKLFEQMRNDGIL